MFEIEAKLKVDSLKHVAEKLTELGAEFSAEQMQRDFYFDDAQKSLTKSDKCLRLRQQGLGRRSKFFLTYKGAREKGRFKRRAEIEVEIADSDSVRKLLSALGYEEVLVFEKRRQIWQLGDCEVALDELALLGFFVEIEGPDEGSIAEAQKKLGLDALSHIPQSYALLMAQKLEQTGSERKEVLLK